MRDLFAFLTQLLHVSQFTRGAPALSTIAWLKRNRAQAKELKDMSAAMSKAEKLLKALFVTMDKAAITN